MKKLLYIFLLNLSVIGFAQDPQLFENTWYLQNVIVDGNNNFPPSNDEVPFIGLDFNQTNPQFITYVCNSAEGEVNFDPNNPIFNFIGDLGITLIVCNDGGNQLYENLYFDFFLDDLTEPFNYSIVTESNGTKTLVITSISGDQTVYGSELLSSEDFQKSKFAIHPNPTKNELFLHSNNEGENILLKIFNLEGKLLSTQNLVLENQISIDVSKLKSGIYFLKIEDENGNTATKKFIKQ